MALKIRRGTNAERVTEVFAIGEPVYITDTEELYIGDGTTTGGIKVTSVNAGSNLIGAPLGAIIAFPTTRMPPGFRICDGSVYDTNVYSDLFNLLGTNTLPNLLGQFLRGHSVDAAVDPSGPRNPLTQQADELKSHNHSATTTTRHKDTQATWDLGESGTLSKASESGAVDTNTSVVTTSIGNTGGVETRPKNTAVVYGIAMFGGAGITEDSDISVEARLDNHDSDILALYRRGSGGGTVDSDFVIQQVTGGVTISGADSDWVIAQMGAAAGSFKLTGTLAAPVVGQDTYIVDWDEFTSSTWNSSTLIEINILVKKTNGDFGTYFEKQVVQVNDATDGGTLFLNSVNTAGDSVVTRVDGLIYSSGNGHRYTSIRPNTTESLNWYIFGKKY